MRMVKLGSRQRTTAPEEGDRTLSVHSLTSIDDAMRYAQSRVGISKAAQVLRTILFSDDVRDGRDFCAQVARAIVEQTDHLESRTA